MTKQYTASQSRPRLNLPGLTENQGIQLALDGRGLPLKTIDNFRVAMSWEKSLRSVRFNELTGAAEIVEHPEPERETVRRWTDTDTANLEMILESDYGLYAPAKLQSAMRLFFRSRSYHPIRKRLVTEQWDGISRAETFLTRWMGCDDTPYVREVSRLIFAGGVRRVFEPGCKFDYVPVLVGPQGSGKSTIVRWLALDESYFAELTMLEGRESIEQLAGAWICEITELLALSRVKEQEAVKSFLSRQRDRCRKPYDREITEQPRQCIFIGTTNRREFLRDRTGNRRFCPVEVHTTGRELYAREAECRAEILQCWLEAAVRLALGEMPAVADASLLGAFQTAQQEAQEADWRVGAIENYIESMPEEHYFCVREVARNALLLGNDHPRDPTQQESREIALILDGMRILRRAGRKRFPNYGQQVAWERADV